MGAARTTTLATLLLAALGSADAQEAYPVRQITMVVPFSAGSQPDVLGRAVAEGLSRIGGQPVVVLNKEGAAGVIAVESVAQSRPDGYTLGFGPPGQFTIQPHLRRDLGYKFESFEFLCQTNTANFVLATGPNSPYRTLAQLIDGARAAPGKLTFGTAGHATGPHIVAESIAAEAGVKFTNVPFKNVGDMYVQVQNGTLDFIATTTVALAAGRGMRGLVVIGDTRLPAHPEIPLLKESGYQRATFPGLLVMGVYAPIGLPAEAAAFLRNACPKAMETPLAKSVADKTGSPIAYLDGPAYAAVLRQDARFVGELLGNLGVKAQ